MTATRSNSVDVAYAHVDKIAEPAGRTGAMKWYDIREPHRSIDAAVRADAARFAADLLEPDDTGFVLVHLCGDDFYFLLVCRWRNNNELWETVVARKGDAPFAIVEGGPTRATFCAWELGVVGFERMAWSAYLRSERDAAALGSYLDATFTGEV